MKSPILFIGYEPSLHDEIRDFLKQRNESAQFSDSTIYTIRLLDSYSFDTVVLNMHRLEDAAILRYINLNYQQIRVLIMPSIQIEEAIPVLTSGKYEILHGPFTLEELKQKLIKRDDSRQSAVGNRQSAVGGRENKENIKH